MAAAWLTLAPVPTIMQLFHLIYVSTLRADINPPEIQALLEKSIANNTVLGVTGMLLVSASNVLQVLEGNKQDVLNTFERIQKDPRHYDLTELLREPIEARNFGEWSMGYRNLNKQLHVSQNAENSLFELGFDAVEFKAKPSIARSLLISFSEMNN